MTRSLRGAWSRRGALLTLLAMTTVVVGGAVAVLAFAEAAGTSAWLMSPLLLLGAVAVPSIGRELATARREEIGLARLRGIRGLRLGLVLLAEPLVTILLGTVLGFVFGRFVAGVAGGIWLDADVPGIGSSAAYAAVGTAVASLLIVMAGSWTTINEPLAVQVASRVRPRRATTLMMFASVFVIVGAAVAAYRSREVVDGAPDALVLLGPALVGLALGQIAIWVLRLLARTATKATETAGMSTFLATRRLSRADDLVAPMRLLVAAAVVGVLALTGATAVSDWVDGEARIAAGGTRSMPVENGAVQALNVTRDLDPEGTHLMAVTVVPNEDRLGERRAYVDAARFDAVVGGFYDDTPAADAAARIPELVTDAGGLMVRGDRLRVASRLIEQESPFTTGLTLRVDYVTEDDSGASVEVPLRPSLGRPDEQQSVELPGCEPGCSVAGLAIGRIFDGSGFFGDDSTYRVLLTDLSVGDVSLLDAWWVVDPSDLETYATARRAPSIDDSLRVTVNTPAGLEVHPLPDGQIDLDPIALADPIPEFAAGADPGTPLDIAGDDRVLGEGTRFDALPLIGGVGQLVDLPTAMLGANAAVADAETSIVLSDDAPDSMVQALTGATGSDVRTLDDVRQALGAAAGADQSRAYALMAAFCALVALLALAAGVTRHLRSFRHDVASLRVLGVGLGAARRAGRTELAALAIIVAVTVAAGGYLAVRLLLGGLPLVTESPAAVPLDPAPDLLMLLVPAVLAAVAMFLVGGQARGVRPGATRPSTLREEEGR